MLRALSSSWTLNMQTDMPQRDDSLASRVRDLEEWRAKLEPRIQALEALLKPAAGPASATDASSSERVLSVVVSNKRWDPANVDLNKFEDNIWWDAVYTGAQLQRSARSIKGILCFCDLFGDPRFQVQVTIDDPIKPSGTVYTRGVGIVFNQFLDDHKWLLATELRNMTFKFRAGTVLYDDGTAERFDQ